MTATVDTRVYDELEALEAILIEHFEVKNDKGVPNVVETVIHPSTGDDLDQQYVRLTLEVKLSADYPDSSPEVFIRNPRGLDDKILSTIYAKLQEKIDRHVGNPIVFELIELAREYLTQCNLPSGQCVICLHGFVKGDVFIKTPCYHHFHRYCLAKHLTSSKQYHMEEMDKLPNWQQAESKPYEQTCPVCRCKLSFDEKAMEKAPPPVDSVNAPPFEMTPELKELQERMAEILARQIARGGVVGSGDDGPPLLTISTPEDREEEPKSSTSGVSTKPVASSSRAVPSTSSDASAGSAAANQPYRGPYRGFNRRGKPGRRGRSAR